MANTLQVFNNMLKKAQPWQAMEDKVKRSDFFLKKVKIKKDFIEEIVNQIKSWLHAMTKKMISNPRIREEVMHDPEILC